LNDFDRITPFGVPGQQLPDVCGRIAVPGLAPPLECHAGASSRSSAERTVQRPRPLADLPAETDFVGRDSRQRQVRRCYLSV